ncbi:disintegrin and metalloproteinase domain-containing protein 10-like [Bolinopsis microptera]|uniref:disintegrin and metalloproteinase domain-containing protein 10-like n=1 Tax=Bolinopsis microptera TaxID=2820187 RepID=UPI003079D6A7
MYHLLLILLVSSCITGQKYIKKFYHVTHDSQSLETYKLASISDSSFLFVLSYGYRDLRIKLYPPHHLDSLSTPLLESHSDHTLLTGYVEGDPNSEVLGHFTKEGIFSGVVYTAEDTIHIEPSHRFGVTTSHNVVYHRSDVDYTEVYKNFKYTTPGNVYKVPKEDIRKENITSEEKPISYSHYVKRSAQASEDIPRRRRTCPVYLVSDHLFFEKHGLSDEQRTKNELILHLHEADKIFRSTDFNQDGTNDNVGFSVANISILKKNTAESKFSDKVIGVKEFLDRWSEYNHDQYCLAVLFTYRDFDSGVLGLAWVASVDGAPGGVCQKRQAVGGYNRNLNTAIVSLINFGRYVGHAVSFITVAHELGHNFGSSHDEDSPSCSPGLEGAGNYIMYARATDGNLPNNVKFSLCSKEAITRVLSVKAVQCFQQEKSYCGNKIKEWNEVCDCGNVETCNDIDHCCTPKSGISTGCVLKRSQLRGPAYHYQCSPQEGPCCEAASCSYTAKSHKCHDEESCKHSSYCNGSSGVCPAAPHKNQMYCNDGSNTCYEGECKGSVCQLVNLAECQCQRDNLCTVCCLEGGMCRPSGSLLNQDIQLTYLMSGRSCNNYKGYCNSDHQCIQVNLENPLTSLDDIFSKKNLGNAYQWLKTHWYYTLTIIGCTFLLCILLKVTYRRSAPMQKYMQHISQTLRRVSKPNSHYQHHQLPGTPNSDEDQEKLARMCAMFPTASRAVTWDVRREAVSEEAAVITMLNLGYPFKPNSL